MKKITFSHNYPKLNNENTAIPKVTVWSAKDGELGTQTQMGWDGEDSEDTIAETLFKQHAFAVTIESDGKIKIKTKYNPVIHKELDWDSWAYNQWLEGDYNNNVSKTFEEITDPSLWEISANGVKVRAYNRQVDIRVVCNGNNNFFIEDDPILQALGITPDKIMSRDLQKVLGITI